MILSQSQSLQQDNLLPQLKASNLAEVHRGVLMRAGLDTQPQQAVHWQDDLVPQPQLKVPTLHAIVRSALEGGRLLDQQDSVTVPADSYDQDALRVGS